MNYNTEITVDTNDGDYHTDVGTISEEDLAKIRPLIAVIREFTDGGNVHNFPCSEHDSTTPLDLYPEFEPEIDLLRELCPDCGYGGFHSIETIRIYPPIHKQVLFNR